MTRHRLHISHAIAQSSEVGLRAYRARTRATGKGAGAAWSKKSALHFFMLKKCSIRPGAKSCAVNWPKVTQFCVS